MFSLAGSRSQFIRLALYKNIIAGNLILDEAGKAYGKSLHFLLLMCPPPPVPTLYWWPDSGASIQKVSETGEIWRQACELFQQYSANLSGHRIWPWKTMALTMSQQVGGVRLIAYRQRVTRTGRNIRWMTIRLNRSRDVWRKLIYADCAYRIG